MNSAFLRRRVLTVLGLSTLLVKLGLTVANIPTCYSASTVDDYLRNVVPEGVSTLDLVFESFLLFRLAEFSILSKAMGLVLQPAVDLRLRYRAFGDLVKGAAKLLVPWAGLSTFL